MFSRQHRKTRPLLILADILLIWLAFESAYAVRSAIRLERLFYLTPPVKLLLTFVFVAACLLAGLWLGVYDDVLRLRRGRLLWRSAQQAIAAGLALVIIQFVQRLDISRPFVALACAFAALFLTSTRFIARSLARAVFGSDSARRHLLICGSGPKAVQIGRLVEASEAFGLQLLGFLDSQPGRIQLSKSFQCFCLSDLPEILRRQVVDEVIFAVETQRLAELEETLLLCEEEGVRTRIHVNFFPHLHSQIALERLEGESMLTFSGAPHDDFNLLVKRAADFVIATIAIVILSPALLFVALLIRATSPGPALFRQQRCGLNGRRFTLYKFRTMVRDAEARKAELSHLNVKQTAFKIPNDPRLTPLGRWLRKFSLDELPQLWNVLRGEMAIVGPRPAVPDEVEQYQRWQRRRLRMRPGLTCLWALAGRDQLDFDDWMRLDLQYIDNWSLSLDWSIMIRTIPEVLLGRGAN